MSCEAAFIDCTIPVGWDNGILLERRAGVAAQANNVPAPASDAERLGGSHTSGEGGADQQSNTALLNSPGVRLLAVKDIQVGRRARSLDPEQVDALVKSIKQLGLKTPITVRIAETLVVDGAEQKDVPVLVAGLHRLEAMKRLKRTEIACFILTGSELDAELWEVDENLCRAGDARPVRAC